MRFFVDVARLHAVFQDFAVHFYVRLRAAVDEALLQILNLLHWRESCLGVDGLAEAVFFFLCVLEQPVHLLRLYFVDFAVEGLP